MTNIDSQAADGSFNVNLDYLINPETTAGVVIGATFAASATNRAIFAMSYTGCRQSGVADATSKATGTSNTITSSTTTVANNCFIIAILRDSSGQTTNTARANTNIFTTLDDDANGFNGADTSAAITPAGAASIGWDRASGAATWGGVWASFAPVAAANNFASLMMALAF